MAASLVLLAFSAFLVIVMQKPDPCGAAHVEFSVANLANATAGGKRFDIAVGSHNASAMLQSALAFIDGVLYDGTHIPRQTTTTRVGLSVDADPAPGTFVAYTVGGPTPDASAIHLSSAYVAAYRGSAADVAVEIKGILYHESTHVWQWDGHGTGPSGLIEGVADYIRLAAHLAPPHWPARGVGDSWDQGYAVTAFFLEYCESLKSGFVRDVNGKLANSTWSLDYFPSLLGKPVDELWADYKAHYNIAPTASFVPPMAPSPAAPAVTRGAPISPAMGASQAPTAPIVLSLLSVASLAVIQVFLG